MKNLIAYVSGILFGLGMAVSGMVIPENVIGFLDLFGDWLPDLAFVMGGGLLVFLPSYLLIIKPRKQPILANKFSLSLSTAIDKPLIVGASLFGLGWGMAGLCPGPAVTSLASGNLGVLVFVIAMLVGIYVADVVSKKVLNA